MFKSKSLRKRLTWYVVFIMLIMSALTGIGVYYGTTHETDEIFDASLVQSARVLDGLVSRATIEINKQQLLNALDQSAKKRKGPEGHKYEKKIFFALLDPNGEILLQSRYAPKLPTDATGGGFSRFSSSGKDWISFALHSSRDDILIVVGERSDIRAEVTEYIGSGVLYPLIFLLPLVIWMLWQIVGVALKPLQAVADQVRAQDLRELKAINVAGVPREIDPLVASLNQMIANLDSAYARERRFVSDASHELRNPLASLLINVDNALEEGRDEALQESLLSMKQSIIRLSHLVSQLLELSHYENPLSSREFESVDLQQLCAEVVETYRQQAEASGLDLELQKTDQDCQVMGVTALLTSMVSNLVDNAIKYCGRQGAIRIHCARNQLHLLLVVEDSGKGLDVEQRAQVSERFYRADITDTSGAGLGLSIVKSIAEIHAASMTLDKSGMGGLEVKIRFELN